MDKPARLVAATVETGPEQPEAPPLLSLDPVIVADRVDRAGAFRPPPFLGDPLRSVGAHDPMRAPPPPEPERRIVGQQPERLDRLRRIKQPYRPRRFASIPHPPRCARHLLPQCGRGGTKPGGLVGEGDTLTEARSGI